MNKRKLQEYFFEEREFQGGLFFSGFYSWSPAWIYFQAGFLSR